MPHHAVTEPIPVVRSASGRFLVHGVPAASDNLVWVLVDSASGECAIVDGPEASGALALIASQGLTLTTILNTHGHGDHVGVNHDLAGRGLLAGLRVVGGANSRLPIPGINEPVDEGALVRFASGNLRVLATDGHVTGHIAFVLEDLVFVGDTLFAGGCGYLFDGPPAAMHLSLKKLAGLAPETHVFCAHEYTEDNLRFAWSVEPGNAALAARIASAVPARSRGECLVPTTIGLERETNPFVRSSSPEIAAAVAAAMKQEPSDSADVFRLTRALKDRRDYRAAPWPPS